MVTVVSGLVLLSQGQKSCSLDGQVIGGHQPLRLGSLSLCSAFRGLSQGWFLRPLLELPKTLRGVYIRKSQELLSPDKDGYLN